MSRELRTMCDWCREAVGDDQPTLALQAVVLGSSGDADTLRKLLGKEKTVSRAGHPIENMIRGGDFFSQSDNGNELRHRAEVSGETWELCPKCAAAALNLVLKMKDAMSPTLSQIATIEGGGSDGATAGPTDVIGMAASGDMG